VFQKDLGVLLRARASQVVCLHSLMSERLMAGQLYVVPIRIIKESRGITPLIYDVGTRWM